MKAPAPEPKKIPMIFFRTRAGSEPVREWLKELPVEKRQAIKKTRGTPDADLALARQRKKKLER